MRGSAFDFVGNLDTLLAVVVGAGLATIGGLIGEHFEDLIARRRKERDAARFFAEIMGSIDALVGRGIESQSIGDRWGPVSMRLFRSAMREAEIYERNRERLFEINDQELRRAIHAHLISETFPLEAIIEYTDEIAGFERRLDEEENMANLRRDKLKKRIAMISEYRENAREFIVFECEKTKALCERLLKYSNNSKRIGALQPGDDQAGNS